MDRAALNKRRFGPLHISRFVDVARAASPDKVATEKATARSWKAPSKRNSSTSSLQIA
jgi:hypothetical protein